MIALARRLEALGIEYLVTGSIASSLQGEPRATHDIDVVVELHAADLAPLLQGFGEPDYYVSADAAADAVRSGGHFNIIHLPTGAKIDFWMLQNSPFDRSRFERRRHTAFFETRLFVSSPEDTILMKLYWARASGGSEKQFGDARSVYELQFQTLDMPYMQRWVEALEIGDLWEKLKAQANPLD